MSLKEKREHIKNKLARHIGESYEQFISSTAPLTGFLGKEEEPKVGVGPLVNVDFAEVSIKEIVRECCSSYGRLKKRGFSPDINKIFKNKISKSIFEDYVIVTKHISRNQITETIKVEDLKLFPKGEWIKKNKVFRGDYYFKTSYIFDKEDDIPYGESSINERTSFKKIIKEELGKLLNEIEDVRGVVDKEWVKNRDEKEFKEEMKLSECYIIFEDRYHPLDFLNIIYPNQELAEQFIQDKENEAEESYKDREEAKQSWKDEKEEERKAKREADRKAEREKREETREKERTRREDERKGRAKKEDEKKERAKKEDSKVGEEEAIKNAEERIREQEKNLETAKLKFVGLFPYEVFGIPVFGKEFSRESRVGHPIENLKDHDLDKKLKEKYRKLVSFYHSDKVDYFEAPFEGFFGKNPTQEQKIQMLDNIVKRINGAYRRIENSTARVEYKSLVFWDPEEVLVKESLNKKRSKLIKKIKISLKVL